MEPVPPSEPPVLRPTGTEGVQADLLGLTADELRVVAAVAALAPALSPSVPARERMRARVLAGLAAGASTAHLTEPDLTEPTAPEPAVAEPGAADQVDELSARRRRGHGARGRFLVAAAAALCLVVALSGISLVLSRDALPGDALYSLKRAGETTQLELTFGDTDRGLRHLDYAARRVDELGALVDRNGTTALGGNRGGVTLAAVEQVDPATVSTLLDDLDAQAAAGSGLLTAVGVAGDPTALGSLSTWAQGQSARLDALRAQLPAGSLPRLDSSVGVLAQVRGRAEALGARLECSPITTGSTDDLGPLPATTACAAPVGATSTAVTAPTGTAPAPSGTVAADPAAPQGGTGSSSGGTSTGGVGAGTAGTGTGSGGTGTGSGGVPTSVPAVPSAPAPPLPTGGVSVPAVPVPTLPPITLPLPLIPPITIGPILPGLPPITIGR